MVFKGNHCSVQRRSRPVSTMRLQLRTPWYRHPPWSLLPYQPQEKVLTWFACWWHGFVSSKYDVNHILNVWFTNFFLDKISWYKNNFDIYWYKHVSHQDFFWKSRLYKFRLEGYYQKPDIALSVFIRKMCFSKVNELSPKQQCKSLY